MSYIYESHKYTLRPFVIFFDGECWCVGSGFIERRLLEKFTTEGEAWQWLSTNNILPRREKKEFIPAGPSPLSHLLKDLDL